MKNLNELPKLRNSISYLYLEHAIIEQHDQAIIAICKDGKIPIPIAGITCLFLGPGVNISHAAIRAICDNGCMTIWCGEKLQRFYASGIGETRSSRNLLRQVQYCMDESLHMDVVRRMYELRFPDLSIKNFTLQQIRGMEGIRVRKTYQSVSKRFGIPWKKRSYKTEDWDDSDPINQALSAANAMLYGVCHAAIVSLGYSAGLGFVHTGKQLSFVYDIGDLYKTETTIPAAFQAVKDIKNGGDLLKQVRIRCREYFSLIDLLSKIPNDLAFLFEDNQIETQTIYLSPGRLWDDEQQNVSGGINYG